MPAEMKAELAKLEMDEANEGRPVRSALPGNSRWQGPTMATR